MHLQLRLQKVWTVIFKRGSRKKLQRTTRAAKSNNTAKPFKQYLCQKNSGTAKIDYRQIQYDIDHGALPTRHFYLMNSLSAVSCRVWAVSRIHLRCIGVLMVIAMLIRAGSAVLLWRLLMPAWLNYFQKITVNSWLSRGALIY